MRFSQNNVFKLVSQGKKQLNLFISFFNYKSLYISLSLDRSFKNISDKMLNHDFVCASEISWNFFTDVLLIHSILAEILFQEKVRSQCVY